MHIVYIFFRHKPYLQVEWLGTTVVAITAATVTMDVTTIVLACIALLSTLITSYFAYLMAKTRTEMGQTRTEVGQTNVKIDDLKVHVNSRMDKMITGLETAAEAKGRLAGVESEKARKGLEDANIAKGVAKAVIPPEVKLQVKVEQPSEQKGTDKDGSPK